MTKLAIEGGSPVRDKMLPYGQQSIDGADIQAVLQVLQSDWLTTGPKVEEFEKAFAKFVGVKEAIAVSNGTAALHCAMYALGIKAGDEVIVPAMTFAASANCIVYQGGIPVFADVEPDTLLLDPAEVAAKVTPRTRAIIAVDYTGQPCDYDALRDVASPHGLPIVADACHAVGGAYKGRSVGTLTDLSTFSFHPVKHFTTGEGGMITTDDEQLAHRMRVFRNHGITTDHRQRSEKGGFFYEMIDLGFNYRLTDFQCALGISQLGKLPEFVRQRQSIAARYDNAFSENAVVNPLLRRADAAHAYHLYMVRFDLDKLKVDRAALFAALRAEGVGVNVHYIPVHLHPYYREHYRTSRGQCPVAEATYESLITLPLFPGMTDSDVDEVIEAVDKVVDHYNR